MSKGIGGHQSAHHGATDDWLTPPWLLRRLGQFDLDPCHLEVRPWDTAKLHYTIQDDGLSKRWGGRVWLNPPYGDKTGKWLARLQDHGNGIALIFARTDTRMFFDHVWSGASGLLFLEGRLYFHYPDGTRARANGGAPSVLIAHGKENAKLLRESGIPGAFVDGGHIERICGDAPRLDNQGENP